MLSLSQLILKQFRKRSFAMFKLRSFLVDSLILNLITYFRVRRRLNKEYFHIEPTHITLIGVGPASVAFIDEIRRTSSLRITIISENDLFGGKCVHFGCMVIDVIKSSKHLMPASIYNKIQSVRNQLNELILKKLKYYDVDFIFGKVVDIHPNLLLLEDGRKIAYQSCIFAMGNVYRPPSVISNSDLLVDIDRIWDLGSGTRILIYSKNNPYAISVASSLTDLGLKVTLLLDGAFVNYSTPSLSHVLADLSGEGVKIYMKARVIRANSSEVVIDSESGTHVLSIDKICALSAPSINLPKYKGSPLLGAHIDEHMCIYGDENLRVIGDSSGTFTVTEAEYIARQVADSILFGNKPKFDLHCFTQKIDAKMPLCFAGGLEADSAHPDKWRQLDFSALGWSIVRRTNGKIWYLYDSRSKLITGIHIYHERAVELIGLAALLMKHQITAQVWSDVSLHPSVVEIFPLLARTILDSEG